jgi:hypothetical protein
LKPEALAILVIVAVTGGIPAEAAESKAPWTLDLYAQEAYESNAQYSLVGGEEAFVTRLDARLGRRFPIRRGRLEVGLSAGGVLYHAEVGRSGFTWGATAAGAWPFSRRTELQLEAASSLGYARQYAALDATGVVPPYALTRTDSGGASFRYGFSRDLRGYVHFSAEQYDFDSASLQDGSTVGVRVGVDQGESRRSTIGGGAAYSRSSTLGRNLEVVRAFAAWTVMPVRDLELRLEAGVGRFGPFDAAEATVRPTLSAEANVRFGRHSASARVAQYIGQTYGLGSIGVNRVFSLGGNFALGPRLDLVVSALESRLADASAPTVAFPNGRTLSAGVRYELPAHLAMGLTYSYWARGDESVSWRNHTVALTLGRRFDWR